MFNYFDLPLFVSGSDEVKALSNTRVCEELPLWRDDEYKRSSSLSNVETIIVDKTYQLPVFTEEEIRKEEWKKIKGFECYQISNLGRVYSSITKSILRPSVSPSLREKDKRTNPIVGLYDYRTINPNSGRYKCFFFYVSSLVSEYFMVIPDVMKDVKTKVILIHCNGNQFDNRVSNLVYVSQVVNDLLHSRNKLSIDTRSVKTLLIQNTMFVDLFKETKRIVSEIRNGFHSEIVLDYDSENEIKLSFSSKKVLMDLFPFGSRIFKRFVEPNIQKNSFVISKSLSVKL